MKPILHSPAIWCCCPVAMKPNTPETAIENAQAADVPMAVCIFCPAKNKYGTTMVPPPVTAKAETPQKLALETTKQGCFNKRVDISKTGIETHNLMDIKKA